MWSSWRVWLKTRGRTIHIFREETWLTHHLRCWNFSFVTFRCSVFSLPNFHKSTDRSHCWLFAPIDYLHRSRARPVYANHFFSFFRLFVFCSAHCSPLVIAREKILKYRIMSYDNFSDDLLDLLVFLSSSFSLVLCVVWCCGWSYTCSYSRLVSACFSFPVLS